MTVAAFMDLALYDPEFGYYARAAQRSGRAGDFFTSVDVGSLFGELLEIQIAEIAALLTTDSRRPIIDLVEAGAGNGRLSADILRAARLRDPDLYQSVRLHLVEASAGARAAQPTTLGEVGDRLVSSTDSLPNRFEGILLANELLDALPTHQVVMRDDLLHEVYVEAREGRLATREGPLSTPRLAEYLQRLGVTLEPGWRAEINLRAVDWVRDVARRLTRGFVILIDYGHEAVELYGASRSAGTLTTFAGHTMAGSESSRGTPAWLEHPGEHDITAHVDFTSVRVAAEAEGLTTLGFFDQTYFLLGLLGGSSDSGGSRVSEGSGFNDLDLKRRLALKTLLMPGGLGSTHKVLIAGKGVGRPPLRGCSYRQRVT